MILHEGQQKALEFHKRFNIVIHYTPTIVDEKTMRLRCDLMSEELREFILAAQRQDIIAIADALGDLLVTVYGTCVSYGIDIEPVFNEIHESNMSKGNPEVIIAPNGKILKAKNWKPPYLQPIIGRQMAKKHV